MTVDPSAPIAIYGPLRGGSTMLRLMLNGHPTLSVPGESDFLFDFIHQDADGWHYDVEGLKADRIFGDSGVVYPEGLDGEAALRDMIAQIGRMHGERPVMMLHRHLDKCAALLPEILVVRILRDPRDVARSSMRMGWAGNTYHGLDPWLETEAAWQKFKAAHPAVATHALRYEDLVTEPEARLHDICDFLGVSYEDSLLSYPEDTSYDAPDAKLAFQWKRKMTPREVQLVEARAGALWDTCGYERSGHPALTLGAAERQWLRLQSRVVVWRRLIAHYGIVAPVGRGLGRRLGLRKLKAASDARMNKMERQYLK